jgi:MFS transporter, AAHS family, 4-hydroxybenzoate transporter
MSTSEQRRSVHIEPASIDVSEWIGTSELGSFQKKLIALMGCSLVMDGFDTQSIGFVAPTLVSVWHLQPSATGPLFAAGLFGMLAGAIVLGWLSDQIGRRRVLLGATLFFGLCSAATVVTANISQMAVLRFFTGFGIGGVMGNATALLSEFSPRHLRASPLMWASCGFTGGAMLGGFVAAVLIPLLGWQSIFVIGGALPLLIALLMWRGLPESPQFLVLRQQRLDEVRRLLQRISPRRALPADTRLTVGESRTATVSLTALLTPERRFVTLLLWVLSFANLLNLYFLANWLPLLAQRMGYPKSTSILMGTLLQCGGLVGAVGLGRLIDQMGFFRVLSVVFAIATLAVGYLGTPEIPFVIRLALVLIGGICIVGAQPAINALAAIAYPTEIRATGVGWSLGVGRAGSIVGPLVTAHLLAMQWSNQALFWAAAIPAGLSCLFILGLARTARPADDVHSSWAT